MEMTFPHNAMRQEKTGGRQNHRAMLAPAIARQAKSPTACAVLFAARTGRDNDSSGSAVKQRIQYFASQAGGVCLPSGAFWATRRTQDTGQTKDESGVYQDALMNSKAHDVDGDGTGEQFNRTGHGASRTL
jgi:hypothetical protein